MKKYHILTVFFLFLLPNLYGQEVCNNGIDDDNNGLIDCFDPACSGSTDCDDFFYGVADPACKFIPTAGNFELEELWNTRVANGGTDGTNNLPGNVPIDQRASVMVGDMDGDGIPEVVAKHDAKNQANQPNSVAVGASNPRQSFVPELYIFNGVDGTIKAKATISANDKFSSLAIGDIDKTDGYTDIFFFNDNGQLERYVFDGTNLIPAPGFTVTGGGNGLYTPNLADFDQDGNVEVYAGNVIFSAHTGELLVNGTDGSGAGSNGAHGSGNEPFSVAFDIDASASNLVTTNLELIAGNKVYDVDFTQPFNSRLTERTSAPAGYNDGVTAITDIDNDGDVDGIIVSQGRVYVWDLQTSTSLSQVYTIPSSTATDQGGRANVANFDGDAEIEIGVAGRSIYIVLNYNATTDMLELVWSIVTDDNSQRTSSTVFDFEGDGVNEIVYSDEEYLYIFDGQGDGSNAKILAQIESRSGTRYDNPLVVDVNGDGQSEVIITAQDLNGPSGDENGYIRCLRSKNKPWVPSRQVWNQHSYMIVNVNDDLTIPLVQQNTTVAGSQAEPKEVINNFLNQASIYTITGNHVFAAPDMQIEFSGSATFCQDASDNVNLQFKISNPGDATLPANVPIATFSSNPYTETNPTLIESFQLLLHWMPMQLL